VIALESVDPDYLAWLIAGTEQAVG